MIESGLLGDFEARRVSEPQNKRSVSSIHIYDFVDEEKPL